MSNTVSHDVNCLRSVVKNTSGARKTFTFLPPHGRIMNPGDQLTFNGSILSEIQRKDRRHSVADYNAFLRAVDSGDLVVVSLPSPILADEVTKATKQLHLHNGSVVIADPCWTNLESENLAL